MGQEANIDLETALQVWASLERNEISSLNPTDYEAAEIVSRGIAKLESQLRIADAHVLITFYGAYPGAEDKDERVKVLEDMCGDWKGLLEGARQYLSGFMEAASLSRIASDH